MSTRNTRKIQVFTAQSTYLPPAFYLFVVYRQVALPYAAPCRLCRGSTLCSPSLGGYSVRFNVTSRALARLYLNFYLKAFNRGFTIVYNMKYGLFKHEWG